jgi:hypothetical protein
MYGLRPIPLLEAKVQAMVADAEAGRLSPDALAAADVLVDAAADAEAVLTAEVEPLAVAADVTGEAAQPTTPTMAATESPPRKARRVTWE